MSTGERMFINLLLCFSKKNDGDIFVCDSVLPTFYCQISDVVYCILDKLKDIQIIWLTSNTIGDLINMHIGKINIKRLPARCNIINTISCNYRYEFTGNFECEKNNSNAIKITNYFLGHLLDEEECRFVEFKEVKGENPCSSIVKIAENYVVAFLNSTVINEGTIAWGINDDRRVVGVLLDYRDKDKIRRELSERFAQIKPYVSPEMYKINFKEIYDEENNIVKNRYIIEIKVKPSNSDFLYATPKGEVYIKTEGGKKKLTLMDVQQELKRRFSAVSNASK